MTEQQHELAQAVIQLQRQFMERKVYNPIDVIIGALGSGDVFYSRVAKRIYKEAQALHKDHLLKNHVITFIETPEFNSDDDIDMYVTGVYTTKQGESYFTLSSREPKLVNMLPHLRFSLDYMPFMAKLGLGIKLDK